MLAAVASPAAQNQVYNTAVGDRTTLNQLFKFLDLSLMQNQIIYENSPQYREFRSGDVRHSQADISKATQLLGYEPKYHINQGIEEAMPWYIQNYQHSKL